MKRLLLFALATTGGLFLARVRRGPATSLPSMRTRLGAAAAVNRAQRVFASAER